jgi:hypothetical protein
LKTYTKSHRREREDGTTFPWIDENLNPNTGDWIAHTRLKSWKERIWDATKGGIECGKDCNHSTYRDLIHPVGPDPARFAHSTFFRQRLLFLFPHHR